MPKGLQFLLTFIFLIGYDDALCGFDQSSNMGFLSCEVFLLRTTRRPLRFEQRPYFWLGRLSNVAPLSREDLERRISTPEGLAKIWNIRKLRAKVWGHVWTFNLQVYKIYYDDELTEKCHVTLTCFLTSPVEAGKLLLDRENDLQRMQQEMQRKRWGAKQRKQPPVSHMFWCAHLVIWQHETEGFKKVWAEFLAEARLLLVSLQGIMMVLYLWNVVKHFIFRDKAV